MATTLKVIVWGLAILSIGYLLPFAIALQRGHRNTLAIFLLDLFLGWSLVGWIVALIWSATSQKPLVVETHA